MRIAKPNEAVTLFMQIDKDDNSQYPQAIIINSAGTIIGSVNLSLVAGVGGKYTGSYIFGSEGDYSVKYVCYSDSSRTIVNNAYRFSDETIRVSNMEQNIEDLLLGNIGRPVAIFD